MTTQTIGLISDTHLTRRVPRLRSHIDAVLAELGARGCDLILHLGDATADAPHTPDDLAYTRACFADAPMPVRFLPGNHDVGEPDVSPNARSGAEPTVSQGALDAFRAALGDDRWCVDLLGWRLIGLDAQIIGAPGLEEQQTAWLDEALRGHTGPIGLLIHKPLFRDGPEALEAHPRYVAPHGTRAILARFAGHDLRFVASGHTHQARRRLVDDVDHIWVPSLAFTFPDAIQDTMGEKIVGMGVLTLTPQSHRFETVVPPGVAQTTLADWPTLYPDLLARA